MTELLPEVLFANPIWHAPHSTHPSFRGKGLGESIIWRVVRQHRREGVQSFLHLGQDEYPRDRAL